MKVFLIRYCIHFCLDSPGKLSYLGNPLILRLPSAHLFFHQIRKLLAKLNKNVLSPSAQSTPENELSMANDRSFFNPINHHIRFTSILSRARGRILRILNLIPIEPDSGAPSAPFRHYIMSFRRKLDGVTIDLSEIYKLEIMLRLIELL
jgi:hypothetical protein